MRVLVTGGAGYIGSHVVWALIDEGHEVVVVDNLSTGVRENLPADVPLVVGNVGDSDRMSKTLAEYRIEAVLHFAAHIVVPESVSNPLKYYQNNTVHAHALISACVDARVRHFVFSSTAAVYGIPDVMPVDENVSPSPINPYGRSKWMTEGMLRDSCDAHPMTTVILRYFNVAGADPKGRTGQSTPAATHLIKVACQTALGRRSHLEVFGTDYDTRDGTCIRDYIHVSDLAQAHVDALAYLERGGDSVTLNCGYGRGYTVREVIDEVRKASGVAFPSVDTERRAGDPPALVACADRLRETLAWTPTHDTLAEMVESAFAWEAKQA